MLVFCLMILFLALMTVLSVLSHAGDVVNVAQSQLGRGEEGKDNAGKYVYLYTQGHAAPWCAGFVSYVLQKSGKSFPYMLSAKGFYKYAAKNKLLTANPKRGDLIVFWRESPQSGKGHIGIIESINEKQIVSIEGNAGKFPAKVKRVYRERNNIKNLLGFIKT